jgi:SAM-dependent methyltransferase
MATTSEWQDTVGQAWAQLYPLTDRAFAGLTQILLERIAALPGDTILDIGCGAGELSLALARARPHAQVVGLDISEALIDVARGRGAQRVNVRFAVDDAAVWQPDPFFAPDLLVSRHGVMFFDDPVAAFGHFRAIASPDARLVFSCFRSPAGNPWASEAARVLDLPPPGEPQAPGPFAFADEEYVCSILAKAGWRDVAMESVDFAFVTGVGLDPVGDSMQFFCHIGPAARALRTTQDETQRVALRLRLERWLKARHASDILAFPAQAWVVSAQRRD